MSASPGRGTDGRHRTAYALVVVLGGGARLPPRVLVGGHDLVDVVVAQLDPRAHTRSDHAHPALRGSPSSPTDRLAPPVRGEVEGGPVDGQQHRVGLTLVDL